MVTWQSGMPARASSALRFAPCSLLFGFPSMRSSQRKSRRKIGYSQSSRAAIRASKISPRAPRARLRRGKEYCHRVSICRGQRRPIPTLAAELVQLNVDEHRYGSPQRTRAAKNATKTIPIVMASDATLSGTGLSLLARPGGNITGLVNLLAGLSGKRLELLKEAIPGSHG